MDDHLLMPLMQPLLVARQEVRECNAYSSRFGLTLNEPEIAELVACRAEALRASGRVEFGSGILPKLIRAFCDSPFLDQDNYASTLAELQELFYHFKSESRDSLSDDELIEMMVKVFHGRAKGAVDFLSGISVKALSRYAGADSDPLGTKESGDPF